MKYTSIHNLIGHTVTYSLERLDRCLELLWLIKIVKCTSFQHITTLTLHNSYSFMGFAGRIGQGITESSKPNATIDLVNKETAKVKQDN